MTIDWWTLGIQTVNVAILIWLLQRFFWRPVAGMIEQRRTSTLAALAEAEATKARATAELAAIDETRAGFARERETILAAAHDAAEQARASVLADATKQAAALQTAATAAIDKAQQAAEAAWFDRSNRLAVEIASRLAARLDGASVRACFLDWLIKAIAALPDQQRQAAELEAVSATVLDAAEQQHASALIGQAFGADPAIVFKTDPTLIAGLELHGPHLVVHNSWRADLAKIASDLSHES